ESGWLELESLDEIKGKAQIRAYTPFPPNFSRDVFVGGLNLFDDLDYVDVKILVEPKLNPKLFHVALDLTFKPQKHTVILSKLGTLQSDKIKKHYENLYWKYAGLQKKIEHEEEYRDQLSHLLIKNLEALHGKNKELATLLDQLKQTQKQLIQQEKMASLGQLTAGIAHEINNPVNYVANNTLALRQDLEELRPLLSLLTALDDKPAEKEINQLIALVQEIDLEGLIPEMVALIKSVHSGSERIQLIVRGLKTFSHQADNAYEFANVSELLESTLTILSNRLREKEIEVKQDYQTIGRLYCKAGKLNQALLNIIDNAIYASNAKDQIHIYLKENEGEIIVEITDHGTGMDEFTLSKIFDPFFTTKESGRGTGLGLYLSYNIVYQDHNGRIQVGSKPGKGTTFIIHLPKNNVR
ncbi:MAG: ATP-binding protein, partial [Bacteroidota bacterium]